MAKRIIRVMFKDSQYNYQTWCNGAEETIKDYFVNSRFNVGSFPVENMQTCINIKFIK